MGDIEEDNLDKIAGRVALSLPHGSLQLEVAKHKLHLTMPVVQPDPLNQTQIGLVYYQHINHDLPQQGAIAIILGDMWAEHS